MLDTVIIGAGVAGLTAGIYTVRAGMSSLLLEAAVVGGMTATSPLIENYPGFQAISGMELMDNFKAHAEKYIDIKELSPVTSLARDEHFTIKTGDEKLEARSIILATGSKYRKLGVKGEQELAGKGVSYCATCDGYFFKGKKIVIVGGGESAAVEALYLHNIGIDVTLVHRRGELRAEKAYQESLKEKDINMIMNTNVSEIKGKDGVEAVLLKNVSTGKEEELPVQGVFIAIGEEPNSALAKGLGVELDKSGYVKVDNFQRTNVPGFYAAGDVTGGIKQITTGVGEGCKAAISAYEDIYEPYWA